MSWLRSKTPSKPSKAIAMAALVCVLQTVAPETTAFAAEPQPAPKTQSADRQSAATAAGHKLLMTNCGGCHGTTSTGPSPLPKAPPFHKLMKRYPASHLEETLAEGIVTGHPDMPELSFSAADIGAMIGYLETISPVRPKKTTPPAQ